MMGRRGYTLPSSAPGGAPQAMGSAVNRLHEADDSYP
jgi:hypothetical protein